jgi:broad specificity phosphatase PhoE
MKAVTDLWLVRHGHSEHHHTRQLQWAEVPLSAEGNRQAERLAVRMTAVEGVSILYSSPLVRAWETATHIADALGLTPVANPDLREIDFGQAGGLTLDEFERRWPELAPQWKDSSDLAFQWPGGESRAGFQGRTVRAMEELVWAHAGERIIVVGHTGTLCCYLAYLLVGDPARWREFPLRVASVSRVAAGPEGAHILLLDDCSHLEDDP